MNAISIRLMGIGEQQQLCLCSLCHFLLTSTIYKSRKINKSILHRPPSHLAEKTVLLLRKLRKPGLSLQGQRKSLPSSGYDHLVLEMISMSRVQCPSSCFMKTLCLESTLNIMLSKPIWPCIKKNWWIAGIWPFFFALCCLGKIPGGTPFSLFFGLGAAWVKSRAERPSVSEVN